MAIEVHLAECVAWLSEYAAKIDAGDALPFDSCVTDPPYHLTSIVERFGKKGSTPAKVPDGGTGAYARASRGFMGKEWDGGDVAFRPETWHAVLACLKPGAHLVAFSGTRTFHRMACAIEDAGFEIRDQLAWVYGTGFPKSHALKNEWLGWGTALKPSWEPICLARKPLAERSVAANVLKHGAGAINIDGCRIEAKSFTDWGGRAAGGGSWNESNCGLSKSGEPRPVQGRFPANLCHDGSPEVLAGFPETGKSPNGLVTQGGDHFSIGSDAKTRGTKFQGHGDAGSASRFFYSAKAGPLDRIGTTHATVKPVDLMRWLCRLVTPPGGNVIDPFAGSGTTGIACMAEGFSCTMLEMESEHFEDIERKLAFLRGDGGLKLREHDRNRDKPDNQQDLGPLFAPDNEGNE